MTKDELEVKKFEFEQKIKLEEIDLKKKELDLNLQQLKSRRMFAPLLLTITGGIITLITGLILNYYESRAEHDLENTKSQSSLLITAAETKDYNDFVNLLDAFSAGGFIKMDSSIIERFKSNRQSSDYKQLQTKLYSETASVVSFLAVSNDFESQLYKEKLSRFWQLYWVELSAVESDEVETRMVYFGDNINKLEENNFKNFDEIQDDLKTNGYLLAQAIKNSLE